MSAPEREFVSALFAPGICSAVATRSAGKCGTWKERMLLSENRCPLFRSMRMSKTILDPTQLIVKSSPPPRERDRDGAVVSSA